MQRTKISFTSPFSVRRNDRSQGNSLFRSRELIVGELHVPEFGSPSVGKLEGVEIRYKPDGILAFREKRTNIVSSNFFIGSLRDHIKNNDSRPLVSRQ